MSKANKDALTIQTLKSRTKKKSKTAEPEYYLFPTPKFFRKKENEYKNLMSKYNDREGVVFESCSYLLLSEKDRLDWLRFWVQVDNNQDNFVNYSRFTDFFHMEKCQWTQRLFDIANYNLTGLLTFAEFIKFCSLYLIIDKNNTENFSFRTLSRRAASFQNERVILDLTDIKYFVKERYYVESIGQRNRRALSIFSNMDMAENGGVTVDEFHDYCSKNITFVKFTHKFITHLRKCIYGISYWVQKSRIIKRSSATGLSAISRLSKINQISEDFCTSLGDPVIDKKRKIIKIKQISIEDDDEDMYSDEKSVLFFKGRFTLDSLPQNIYEDDFPEIIIQKQHEKLLKRQKQKELFNFADFAASGVYKHLLEIISDLIRGNRGLRMAFRKWIEVNKMIEKMKIDPQSDFNDNVNGKERIHIENEEGDEEEHNQNPNNHKINSNTINKMSSSGNESLKLKLKLLQQGSSLAQLSIETKKGMMNDLLRGRGGLDKLTAKLTSKTATGEAEETLHE
eukprot:gene12975-27386_t